MIMTVAGVLGVSCSSHTVTDDGEDSPFPDRREVCVLISAPAAAKQRGRAELAGRFRGARRSSRAQTRAKHGYAVISLGLSMRVS